MPYHVIKYHKFLFNLLLFSSSPLLSSLATWTLVLPPQISPQGIQPEIFFLKWTLSPCPSGLCSNITSSESFFLVNTMKNNIRSQSMLPILVCLGFFIMKIQSTRWSLSYLQLEHKLCAYMHFILSLPVSLAPGYNLVHTWMSEYYLAIILGSSGAGTIFPYI